MEKTDREGENVMQALFDAVNAICGKIQVVSDLFWEFPTNFGWYAAIPILGNFSLAIILLVGAKISARRWQQTPEIFKTKRFSIISCLI